jgi:hypothetical protein
MTIEEDFTDEEKRLGEELFKALATQLNDKGTVVSLLALSGVCQAMSIKYEKHGSRGDKRMANELASYAAGFIFTAVAFKQGVSTVDIFGPEKPKLMKPRENQRQM